jgi:hypothetical protein
METWHEHQSMRDICDLNLNWLKPYKALSIRATTPKMYNTRDSQPSRRAIHSIVQYRNPNEDVRLSKRYMTKYQL